MRSRGLKPITRWMFPLVLALLVVLVAAACGEEAKPTPPAPAPAGPTRITQPAPTTAPTTPSATGPTRITVAAEERTNTFWQFGDRDADQMMFVSAGLVGQNLATEEYFALLVEKLPNEADGSVVVNADGSLVVTYTLREGLTWHDGVPLTAYDFEFAYEVQNSEKADACCEPFQRSVESVYAQDERNFVLEFHSPFVFADRLQLADLAPLPRHILENLWDAAVASEDYSSFETLSYWNADFVGVGPYELVDYGDGEVFKLAAFDNFALGRPKIDEITVQVIEDATTALTAFLAGELDWSMGSLDLAGGKVLKDRWDANGEGTVDIYALSARSIASNLNPWLKDPKVKQALLHAIDREAINEAIYGGYSQVLEVPLGPAGPAYEQAMREIAHYPYDPERALELMAEAGWNLDAPLDDDGLLVNGNGERFVIEYRSEAGNQEHTGTQAIVADYWSRIGVEVVIANMSDRLLGDEEYRGRWPGVATLTFPHNWWEWREMWHTSDMPSEDTEWSGDNEAHWSDPLTDRLIEQLEMRQSPQEQRDLQVEFMKYWAEVLPVLPISYGVEISPISKRLQGPTRRAFSGGYGGRSWNNWEWTVTE